MIKYTITIHDGSKEATGYISSKYPLVGDEEDLTKNIKAIIELLQPREDDEYFDLFHQLIRQYNLERKETI